MSWGGGKVIVNTDKREMKESRVRDGKNIVCYTRESLI